MSRSFRESYMGWPYQATRGWYLGKKREAAKSARYRLARLVDEDGIPDHPSSAIGKWSPRGYRLWRPRRPGAYEIIWRNHRKFMRKCRKA